MAFLMLSGCRTLAYYGQAVGGQLHLLALREPVTHILERKDASQELKGKLRLARRICRFAENRLGLPLGDNYTSYADLGRPYAVYTLYAAPEFSMTPKTWCYPFVGCLAYHGYFSKLMAAEHKKLLEAEGYDVFVGGANAYSTLGWFNDPLLNTFIFRSEARLAYLLFHELAHKKLFVKGDTDFNEGFATAVGWEGVRRYLADDPEALAELESRFKRHRRFVELVLDWRERLEALYELDMDAAARREVKAETIADLKRAYQRLKKSWGGHDEYDDWFASPINNAQIVSVAAYNRLVPAFEALLAEHGGDLEAFYRACEELGESSLAERTKRLEKRL
jgi:predicted aminopeptidase